MHPLLNLIKAYFLPCYKAKVPLSAPWMHPIINNLFFSCIKVLLDIALIISYCPSHSGRGYRKGCLGNGSLSPSFLSPTNSLSLAASPCQGKQSLISLGVAPSVPALGVGWGGRKVTALLVLHPP